MTVHSGFDSEYDFIGRFTYADAADITAADYPDAYRHSAQFRKTLLDPIVITFEADNGWWDVSGNQEFLTGSLTPYASSSPGASGANGRTTLVPGSNTGNHNNGTAKGTIEYIHADGGAHTGNRIHFNLENVGHYVSVDEPDLARLNTSSNIDRGINTTFGTDQISGDPRDQFLEVLPSERNREGGLIINFSGNEAASGDGFANPVTAFGFYLMGREIKRDVYLDVYNTNGDLIHSAPTMEPSSTNQAVVEYITFTLDYNYDDYPIQSIHLREEISSTDTPSDRDIFSIDDLILQFADYDDNDDFDGVEYYIYNNVTDEKITLCDYDDESCIAALQQQGFYMLSPEIYGEDAYDYPAIYKSPGIVWDQSEERKTNGDWTMYSTSDILSDRDEDGFVDEVTNYQMWTSSGGIDLTNRRGKTYSDDTSRKWDAIKAVEVEGGFSILVEGQRNKDGKFKVVSADDEGVIGGATRWLSGNQMLNEGYDELFAMDFSGNNQIGY